MSISCRIVVLGREIPIRTTASPELVEKIETMVNDRLATAAASMSLPDEQMVAILAMLNMAEEIVTLRQQNHPDGECAARLERLVHHLDNHLVAGSR